MTAQQIIKKLEENGWVLSRIRGSHHMMVKEGFPRPVPVPMHGSTDLKKPVVKAIEKQTGVKLL